MLRRTLYAERMKLKHSPVWLAFLILPIIPAVMGTFNYYQNIGILTKEWYSLWSQQTLFSCFFFLPVLIGVYCSYLYRLEHLNQNWNTIMAVPIPIAHIHIAKLISTFSMIILTQVWTGILFIISGKLVGLTSPVPAALPNWLFWGAIGGIAISALQLLLSLVIRSFAVPVGIALIGGISGLVTFAKGIGVWNPYSLLAIGMRANYPGGPMQANPIQFLINSLVFILIFSICSSVWIKMRDV